MIFVSVTINDERNDNSRLQRLLLIRSRRARDEERDEDGRYVRIGDRFLVEFEKTRVGLINADAPEDRVPQIRRASPACESVTNIGPET